MEKAMAPHSSTLAWKIPWTKELGRLQSMARSRTRLSDFTFTSHLEAKWGLPRWRPGKNLPANAGDAKMGI